ncbi:hypothetical protein [Alistipes sp.]|uniref:hypothetical protein n=1 Tax=Alistipes sp. TaxID=1872444 RepID=UPI003527DCFA
MKNEGLKTEYQAEKQERELAIYNEYNELMAQPGAMATAVSEHLMRKYGFHAKSTIFFIRKRVERRLKEQSKL